MCLQCFSWLGSLICPFQFDYMPHKLLGGHEKTNSGLFIWVSARFIGGFIHCQKFPVSLRPPYSTRSQSHLYCDTDQRSSWLANCIENYFSSCLSLVFSQSSIRCHPSLVLFSRPERAWALLNVVLCVCVSCFILFFCVWCFFSFERFEVLAVFASTVLVQLGALFILKERWGISIYSPPCSKCYN